MKIHAAAYQCDLSTSATVSPFFVLHHHHDCHYDCHHPHQLSSMHRHCHALKIQCCISYLPFLCLQYDQNCHHHHHHCRQPYHHYLCVFIPHIKEKLSGHSVSPYPDSLSNDVLFLAPSGVLYLIPMRHYRSNTPLSQFSLSPMPQIHNSGPKLLQHHQRNSGQLTQLTNRLFRPTILTLPTSFH